MVFFLFNVLFGGAGGGGGQPSKEFDPDPFLGELRWDARAPAMAATAPDIFWVDQERLRGMFRKQILFINRGFTISNDSTILDL